ncbi:MAG: hypothetical protein LBH64_00840 [Coriobacteriales bacterium]|nr:hypothetical protein [Coriobacteriales bacterium]
MTTEDTKTEAGGEERPTPPSPTVPSADAPGGALLAPPADAPAPPSVGLWSRSRALRIVAWILSIVVALVLALCASAYLSGFDSVHEMISWLIESL